MFLSYWLTSEETNQTALLLQQREGGQTFEVFQQLYSWLQIYCPSLAAAGSPEEGGEGEKVGGTVIREEREQETSQCTFLMTNGSSHAVVILHVQK